MQAFIDLFCRHMEPGLRMRGDSCQCWLPELGAASWDGEAATFQVTNRHTRAICVYKVLRNSAGVSKNSCFAFTVEELAVIDQQACSDTMTKWLRL